MTTIKSFIYSAIVAAGMASGCAGAAPLTVDELLGSAALSTSDTKLELAQLQLFAGKDAVLGAALTGNGPVQNGSALAALQGGLWVIDVSGYTPGYFVLKFGGGGKLFTNQDHYFFKNVGEMDKLVFSNQQVNYLSGGNCWNDKAGSLDDAQCNIFRLSHYAFSANVEVKTVNPDTGTGTPQGGSGTGNTGTAGGGGGGQSNNTGPAPTDVPEPASLALLGLGLAGLALSRRRRRRG